MTFNNKKNAHPLLPKNSKNFSEEINEYYNPNQQLNEIIDKSIIKNRPFLDRPGKIKYAKKHASADRPLHKIKNFTKETDFCQCCNLPCETKNIIEPFKICDSTDKFSECGLGIALYFYYFRFCILCLGIVLVILALPLIIYNAHYSNQLNIACDNNINRKNISICDKYEDDDDTYNFISSILQSFSSEVVNEYFDYGTQIIGNQDNVKKTIISYIFLDFLSTLCLLILCIYIFLLLKLKINKEKSKNCSPSDYTLFISNINNSLDYYEDYCISKKRIIYNDKERFKDFITFLKNKIIYTKKKSDDIYDINFCYKLKDFMKSGEQIQTINYELLQIVNNSDQKKCNNKYRLYGEKRRFFEICCGCACKKGRSIKKLLRNREINQIKLDYLLKNSKILTKDNFSGSIFLTFNTIQQKEEYYTKYHKNIISTIISFFKEAKYYCCNCVISEKAKRQYFRRKNLTVSEAFEPEDVIWENIQYDKWSRFQRFLLINFFTLILLFFSFLIILGLTNLKEYAIKNKVISYYVVKYGISLIISGTVSGFNELFYYLLENLTKNEKPISMTNFYLSYSIKLTIFTFITSGIVPLVCHFIQNGIKSSYENLIDNIFIIFLTNSFVTPLLWTFDIGYFFKKIKICLIERKKEPNLHHNMTQRELNELYQLPNMKISYKYSYIAKTLLLSLFYIPIFPLGLIISLIGFIFGYYLELYNFTHLYNRPEMINEKICLFYIEYFDVNLFFLNLGIYIFFKDVYGSKILIIILLIIFGILSVFPFTKLINCQCLNIPKKILLNTTLYDEVYFSFYNDYQRQNPMTKIDGLKNYITKLRINGYISQKVYNFSYMNIDTINVMELYYRSELNRNIVQSQIALANYKNNTYRNSIRLNKKKRKKLKGSNNSNQDNYSIINKNKEILGSAIYDEQLVNLLKQSIYRQKFGSNLDNLNQILSNKNLYRSSISNMQIDNKNKESESGSNTNKEDEIKSESTMNEKNRNYILRQYENPFLLSISHNIANGDLSMFHSKNKKYKPLDKIQETSELNENIDLDSIASINRKEKKFYGVDFDIYSNKSSFSKKSEKNEINIEMEDLSEKNKKNKYNYEMSDYNNKREKFENIKDINLIQKKKKKLKDKNEYNKESPNFLKENSLNITKGENNYDGDYDSDS